MSEVLGGGVFCERGSKTVSCNLSSQLQSSQIVSCDLSEEDSSQLRSLWVKQSAAISLSKKVSCDLSE